MDMGPATPVTVENAAFLYNAVGKGDGKPAAYGASRSGDEAFGGAMSIVNAVVDIKDTSFVGNEAGQGGAISVASHKSLDNTLIGERQDWAKYQTKITMTRVEVHSNIARVSGGAMFVEDAQVEASATHFGDYFNVATEVCRSGQRFWDELKMSAKGIVLPTRAEVDAITEDNYPAGNANRAEGLAAAAELNTAIDSFNTDIMSATGLLNAETTYKVHQKDIGPNVQTIKDRIHAIISAVDYEGSVDKNAKDALGKLQDAIRDGPIMSDTYGLPCGAPILGDSSRFIHQDEYAVAKSKDVEIDSLRGKTLALGSAPHSERRLSQILKVHNETVETSFQIFGNTPTCNDQGLGLVLFTNASPFFSSVISVATGTELMLFAFNRRCLSTRFLGD
jgi:predicted outer membrane repeat protein